MLNVARFALAVVLTVAPTFSMAQLGPFTRETPAMSEVPSLVVLSTTTVLDKVRPETVIDRSGVRHVFSYDVQGRINAITQPILKRVYIAGYDEAGKLSELTLIDLTTGKTLYSAARKPHNKIIGQDGVEYQEQIIVVGSYDNAQATDFWGGSGPGGATFMRLDPGPLGVCSKAGCNAMCDKANNLAMSLCGLWAIAQPLAGGACIVAALIAYSGCGSHCDGDCLMP